MNEGEDFNALARLIAYSSSEAGRLDLSFVAYCLRMAEEALRAEMAHAIPDRPVPVGHSGRRGDA